MSIIRPSERLCAGLLTIGLPEYRHNRRVLRGLLTRSTGVPPGEHEPADELAQKVLDLHKSGGLAPLDE
jgi:hypothetical protein